MLVAIGSTPPVQLEVEDQRPLAAVVEEVVAMSIHRQLPVARIMFVCDFHDRQPIA